MSFPSCSPVISMSLLVSITSARISFINFFSQSFGRRGAGGPVIQVTHLSCFPQVRNRMHLKVWTPLISSVWWKYVKFWQLFWFSHWRWSILKQCLHKFVILKFSLLCFFCPGWVHWFHFMTSLFTYTFYYVYHFSVVDLFSGKEFGWIWYILRRIMA